MFRITFGFACILLFIMYTAHSLIRRIRLYGAFAYTAHSLGLVPDQQGALALGRKNLCDLSFSTEQGCTSALVARIGDIMGSPAASLMTLLNEEESALARLRDVFRVGVRGQTFRDFVELGHKKGQCDAEIHGEWKACEQAVPCWSNPVRNG